ncbi:MAG TPA: hypothetical protein VF708_19910 [Pyrinomonadaceae bacterium]|jgi:hypothetical protein
MWLLKQFVFVLVRYLMGVLVGLLVSRQLIEQAAASRFVESYSGKFALFLLTTVPLCWSMGNKWYQDVKAEVHRQAKPNTPRRELRRTVRAEVWERLKDKIPFFGG